MVQPPSKTNLDPLLRAYALFVSSTWFFLHIFKQWGWKAKVLQPYKADQHGQGWLVGAETPPPMNVFQTNNGDVLVTMHKRQSIEKAEQVILAPTKTKTFLRPSITGGRERRGECYAVEWIGSVGRVQQIPRWPGTRFPDGPVIQDGEITASSA